MSYILTPGHSPLASFIGEQYQRGRVGVSDESFMRACQLIVGAGMFSDATEVHKYGHADAGQLAHPAKDSIRLKPNIKHHCGCGGGCDVSRDHRLRAAAGSAWR